MERDKRGRFIKRMQTGGEPDWLTKTYTKNGKSYHIFKNMYNTLKNANFNDNLIQQLFDETYKDTRSYMSFKNVFEEISTSPEVITSNTTQSSNQNTTNNNQTETTTIVDTQSNQEQSAGFNPVDNTYENNILKPISKTKLSDYLEITKAGIGLGINNKIADRALEVEKPYLQNPVEHYRTVYGDYRAQKQGEQAAAQLRQTVSQPLTSDGAVQTNAMLTAQLKGQEFINEGNAQDDNLIKQTRETAWQQEKENRNLRHSVAEENRKTLLQTQKNKSTIENMRDSANYSQIIDPLLSAKEQRLRQKAKQQEQAEEAYNEAIITNDVWNTYTNGLSALELEAKDAYLTGGNTGVNTWIGEDITKKEAWLSLQKALKNEIIRRQAQLQGVYINPTNYTSNSSKYGLFANSNPLGFKQGGTIYKARLTKRTKDNDRTAKSTEVSKKIAAKFLEKALDSLYTYKDVELIARPVKKKKKYQAGGGLPFVGFTPVFATSETGAPAQQAKTESEKKGEDLTTKDILELLKDMDGLPSDMQLIQHDLQNFILSDQTDPLGLSSSSNIASNYINLINKIKVAQFNKNEYNNAFNQLKGNGGLSELAITSEGHLIGTNSEGDFKYFSVSDVKDGKPQEQGYSLLTNSNLLYLRANSIDAAFNHQLTTVAQNGIGMATINTLIANAVNRLGTDVNSQEGYISTKQGDLISGLQEFQKAIQASGGEFDGTINDLYKYKYLTKSQATQAKKAMQYLYSTLPENARTLLKVKSDGTEQGALKLIETIISSKETTEQSFDLDLVEGNAKNKSSSNTSAKDNDKLKTSLPLNVQKGIGGIDSYIDIDRGDGIHMFVKGTQFNLIKTPNGESITDTSLATMLSESGLQGIVKDMRNIQFGDQKLSPDVLSNITYNNTGVTRANLPIKPDGSVNLELLEAYELAEQELDVLTTRTPEQVKKIYEKYGLTSLLNSDGTYNQDKFAPFMITEGYTTNSLSGLKDSEFVKEYTGDENFAVSLMEKSLAVGSGKNTQTPEVDTYSWYNPADWFGWVDKIYKGTIYIPLDINVNAAVYGANHSLDYDEAMIQEEKYQNFDKITRQRSVDADILNI